MSSFLITIDTEGDNIWAAPREVTTRNAAYLPRFQELCERYGLKPTWLVNFEMAASDEFVEFGHDVLARGQGEIGMHLHAWDTPPVVPLTSDDVRFMPYLIEYPEPVLRAKIGTMTRLLEDTFSQKMTSHRAGRWAFNAVYARVLAEQGYLVDCSVTPHVDWGRIKGNPDGAGGVDYRYFPDQPYFLDLDDIARPGNSSLLEVPMTVTTDCPKILCQNPGNRLRALPLAERAIGRIWPKRWLRPNGRNRDAMLAQIEALAAARTPYVEFMLHSSEFMPGGSPTFPDANSIERLYDHMEALFERASTLFDGATLSEFRSQYSSLR